MSKLLGPLDRKMRHHEYYIEKNPQNLENQLTQLPEKDAKKILVQLGVTTHLAVSWGRSVLRTFRVWKANVRAQNKQINAAKQLAEQAEQEATSMCGFVECTKCGTFTQGSIEAQQHEQHCRRRKSTREGGVCSFCRHFPEEYNFTLRARDMRASHCSSMQIKHTHPSTNDLLCENCDKYYEHQEKNYFSSVLVPPWSGDVYRCNDALGHRRVAKGVSWWSLPSGVVNGGV